MGVKRLRPLCRLRHLRRPLRPLRRYAHRASGLERRLLSGVGISFFGTVGP